MNLIFPHIIFLLGFLFAAVLVAHIIRQRNTPAGTSSWLLLIVLLPYIGVPLYLLFGGRKSKRTALTKEDIRLIEEYVRPAEQAHEIEKILRSQEIPGATLGNEVKLCTDGTQAYNEVIKLINEAKTSIYIAIYVLKNDSTGKEIIEILSKRAAEGIKVRLLIDSFGSLLLLRFALRPLIKAGGKIASFMPLFTSSFRGRTNLRNHRKMLIIDQKKAWAGGANIASEYISKLGNHGEWQDITFTLEGPAVRLYSEIFQSDWEFATKEKIEIIPQEKPEEKIGKTVQIVPSGPDIRGDPLYHAIISAIFIAKKRIWITTPYFIPESALIQALTIAALRGIDVRIILPKKSNHLLADIARETYLSELQEAGGKVLLFGTGMLHAKALLMDSEFVMAGSANIDVRSLLFNYEVSTLFYDHDIAKQTEGWMKDLMKNCNERIRKQNFLRELLEGLVRIISPVL